MKVLIITGLSGAGKSSVVKSLEDIGYYCIDNLPPKLMKDFFDLISNTQEEINKVAFVIDLRSGAFFDELDTHITRLKKVVKQVEILFLDASDDVILNRYKESRRSHPFSNDGTILDGVNFERERFVKIKEKSDYIIDTTNMNIHQLRDHIKKVFQPAGGNDFNVIIESFGFRKGIITEADMIFDLRFLPNPFYIDELRDKTGLDKEVREYIMSFKDSEIMLEKMNEMIEFLIPRFEKEDKNEMLIGIGCTGGNHRSVTFAYLIDEYLSNKGFFVKTIHRDIRK